MNLIINLLLLFCGLVNMNMHRLHSGRDNKTTVKYIYIHAHEINVPRSATFCRRKITSLSSSLPLSKIYNQHPRQTVMFITITCLATFNFMILNSIPTNPATIKSKKTSISPATQCVFTGPKRTQMQTRTLQTRCCHATFPFTWHFSNNHHNIAPVS